MGIDGWDLYRKGKISMNPVRRYCSILDQDYKKNKMTVCAHLTNLYNSFQIQHGNQIGLKDVNFFDIEKWNSKHDPAEDKDNARNKVTRKAAGIETTESSPLKKEKELNLN